MLDQDGQWAKARNEAEIHAEQVTQYWSKCEAFDSTWPALNENLALTL